MVLRISAWYGPHRIPDSVSVVIFWSDLGMLPHANNGSSYLFIFIYYFSYLMYTSILMESSVYSVLHIYKKLF